MTTQLKKSKALLRKESADRKRNQEEKSRLLERVQRQNVTLIHLATHPALAEGRFEEALQAITEAGAETIGVDLVNIWRLSADGREFYCLEDFDRSSRAHTTGRALVVEQYPRFFAALATEQAIDASNVKADPRTADLTLECWDPRNIGASLSVPIRLHGRVVGLVCYDQVEFHRNWSSDEVSFANQIGSLVAQLFLSADLYRRADEMAAITRISHEITALSDLHQVYHSIARHAAELSHSDASGVFNLRSNGRLYVEVGHGVQNKFIEIINAQGILPGYGAIGRAAIEHCPIRISDILVEPGYPYGQLAEMEHIRGILAVPMLRGEEVIGGIVLWHRQPRHFTSQEVAFIQALAQECVNAVENARLLEAEARRYREAETLRMATQALSSTLDLQCVFELILSELQKVVPYDSASVQQLIGNQLEIIGGHGFPNLEQLLGVCFDLTANDNPNREVVRTRSPFILDDAPAIYNEFHREPHVQANIHSWLGVPLIFGNRLIGMIALDKQEPGFYTQEHAQLALAFANQAAIAIENARMFDDLRQAEEDLRKLNEELEQRVEARTKELKDANEALQKSLETLQRTQAQLVQSEKMAALGDLVAGVSHEINTPIGVGVTAASYLQQKSQEIAQLYQQGTITRSDLESYLKTATESSEMILNNLRRAADHIRSFKQVAVDQTSGDRRTFKLKEYLDEVLLSLHPKLKKTKHTIIVHCPDDLEIDSYPGAFSQIITNFVLNSLKHGFEGKEQGHIVLEVTHQNGQLQLRYNDDGRGMTQEERSRIFEPFYTTKRSQGGSGLGLHIVYNLVTQKLNGCIECESASGVGTTFIIQMPLEGEKG